LIEKNIAKKIQTRVFNQSLFLFEKTKFIVFLLNYKSKFNKKKP
jgi:hypothetical protein